MAGKGYVHSLEQFVQKMVDPGEDYPVEEKPVLKIEDFTQILNIVQISSVPHDIDYSLQVQIFLRVFRQIAYYVLDDPLVSDLFNQSTNILKTFISDGGQSTEKVSIALEIY
jgi:hypothetical protein